MPTRSKPVIRRTSRDPDPHQIYILASLRRVADRYSFCIRWILGASNDPNNQADSLPRWGSASHPGDTFGVVVQRGSSPYLQADGTWGANRYEFKIAPQPYAMLDPPRMPAPVPEYEGTEGRQWLVAATPTGPVDPAVDPEIGLIVGQGSRALGVAHISGETDKARVAKAMYRVFRREMLLAKDELLKTAAFSAAPIDKDIERAARALAIFAMRSGDRVSLLPRRLGAEIEKLRRATFATDRHSDGAAAGEARLFDLSLPATDNWRVAALVAKALGSKAALEFSDRHEAQSRQLRSHLRMRALQGGTMADFWGGLTSAVGVVTPEDRGKIYPAAELFGMGCTLASFTADEVRAWSTLPNNSSDFVTFTVTHYPPPASSRVFRSDDDGGVLPYGTTEDPYTAGNQKIDPAGLRRALDVGSSNPPRRPEAAKVKYDLVRNWIDTSKFKDQVDIDKDGSSLSFGTGDGKVEIVITPPPIVYDAAGDTDNAVLGFNVYGVWEGASAATDNWFLPGAPEPSLNDLKPWRITRRYSYERDLKGVFPSAGGKPADALTKLLEDPPWHPILLRASKLEDRTKKAMGTGPVTALPNANDDADSRNTTWSHDLRQGMHAGRGAPAGVHVRWDPAYPMETRWTPEMARDDDPNNPVPRKRPQAYRFWVTSVDGMEQESEPLPVLANDTDARQPASFIYLPRFRTQIPPVPQGLEGGDDELTVIVTKARDALAVSFASPRRFLLGDRDTAGTLPPRIDSAKLEARVLLVRRRLTRKVVSLATVRSMQSSSDDAILKTHPWQAMLKSVRESGWDTWQSKNANFKIVTAPNAKGRWEAEFTLEPIDHGFEYEALVGFSCAAAQNDFWMPIILSRTAQVTVKDEASGKFSSEKISIPESPAVGNVVASAVVPVVNNGPARPAEPSIDGGTVWAKPVLPPPGVDRDLVLKRLLSNKVATGTLSSSGPELTEWLTLKNGRQEPLSLAQAMMGARALDRLKREEVTFAPGFADLSLARRILAREMGVSDLRMQATIGFRGIQCLRFRYVPFRDRGPAKPPSPGQDAEAEAATFRIFCARAPIETTSAQTSAIRMKLKKLSGQDFEVVDLDAGTEKADVVAALRSPNQPALVRFSGEVFGEMAAFVDGGAKMKITIAPIDGVKLPTGAGIPVQVYLGVHLADVPVETYAATREYSVYLPVGGGEGEAFIWWIIPTSTQEIMALRPGWRSMFKVFPPSTKPNAPAPARVRSVARSDEFYLDPSNPDHKDWCPKELSKEAARIEARLYVAWDAPEQDLFVPKTNFLVEVDRDFQLVGSPNAFRTRTAHPEWEAIEALEILKDNQLIDPTWIDHVGQKWLRGLSVEPKPGASPAIPYVSAPDRRLQAATGIKLIAEPGGAGGASPTLVDYFKKPNDNTVTVMDSEYEYKYRIRWALAVDAIADPDWQYLRSDWSPWSPHVIPMRPALKVQAVGATKTPIDGVRPPRVVLNFVAGPPAKELLAYKRLVDQETSTYRIMVQRKIHSSFLKTTEDSKDPKLAWFEIGSPLVMNGVIGSKVDLPDDSFEREDIASALKLTYRIQVMQFVAKASDGGQERLVRKLPMVYEFVDVDIPPIGIAGATAQEWQMNQLIHVY